MYVYHVHVVPTDARKKRWIPWNWSYKFCELPVGAGKGGGGRGEGKELKRNKRIQPGTACCVYYHSLIHFSFIQPRTGPCL